MTLLPGQTVPLFDDESRNCVMRRFGTFQTKPLVTLACLLCWIGLSILAGCASTAEPGAASDDAAVGIASYYADRFHGRRTASGELYDRNAMTAAHRRLPFGTRVRVINLENGQAVDVRINDRGPFVAGRVIDVSYAAARQLGMLKRGIVKVRVEPMD
jgi:rare lipoprotein A